jgi:N-acetyl-anhydromuramyl-L-alanine amidase AmpD
LLETACEAIGAYYGYDVKEKVFVKQFDKIVNIFGHDDPTNYETDSDADENPAT